MLSKRTLLMVFCFVNIPIFPRPFLDLLDLSPYYHELFGLTSFFHRRNPHKIHKSRIRSTGILLFWHGDGDILSKSAIFSQSQRLCGRFRPAEKTVALRRFSTHLPDRLFRLGKLLFDLAAFQRCKPPANADKRQAIFRKLPQMRNRPRSREVILFPIGRTFPCLLRSDMDTVVLLSQFGGKLL